MLRSPKFLVFACGAGAALAAKLGLEAGDVEPWVRQGIDLLLGALGLGTAVAASGAAKAPGE